MPLVSLSSILKDARKKKYGVGMFDVHNLEMTNAVIEAAEEEKSPVILALAEVHAVSPSVLEDISNIITRGAQRANVPVCAHFDHGLSLDNCIRVLHCGFSSVMFDGSTLPYEENIKKTAEFVRFASLFNASVEAELGHVGNAEGGGEGHEEAVFTDPDQTEDFIRRTGVDALAVSIGTVHGHYTRAPCLNLEILSAINKKSRVPLVLHGGSGLSDQDFCNCIQNGISKINIYTDLIETAMKAISGSVNQARSLKYPDLMNLSVVEMKEYVRQKLRLFGSSGRI
ncbi:MAG: class II fructose-bisphosphate aldolase [Treponema sp.]|jgi:fructose-bisphosphate aldolase class II|nr:class II fructose-bisphosphate aldolase [Treponema sp.]